MYVCISEREREREREREKWFGDGSLHSQSKRGVELTLQGSRIQGLIWESLFSKRLFFLYLSRGVKSS